MLNVNDFWRRLRDQAFSAGVRTCGGGKGEEVLEWDEEGTRMRLFSAICRRARSGRGLCLRLVFLSYRGDSESGRR